MAAAKSYSYILLLLIVQFGLVQMKSLSAKNKKYPTISLSLLIDELQKESPKFLEEHLQFIFVMTSLGETPYKLSKNVSAECFRTGRASMLLFEDLAEGYVAAQKAEAAFEAAARDIRSVKPDEHPLESVCQKVAVKYAEDATLASSFEKAKQRAASEKLRVNRRPLARQIVTSEVELALEVLSLLDKPSFLKFVFVSSFLDELNETEATSTRLHFFALSVVAVARKSEFADKLQGFYEKAINDMVDKVLYEADIDLASLMPTFANLFYGYIRQDSALVKEINNAAALVGARASIEDLDFSKF